MKCRHPQWAQKTVIVGGTNFNETSFPRPITNTVCTLCWLNRNTGKKVK